jgi:type III secretion system FlhB-like substrate exporter
MGMKKSLALRYWSGLPAPFVSAKGQGRVAERIEAIASRAGVPIVRNELAAESLYPLDLGDLIPEAYFEVIARILAAVMHIEENK